MRRVWVLAAFVACGVVLAVVLGPGRLRTDAQGGTPPAAGRGFVGSWLLTVPGTAPAHSLATVMADGTLIDSDPPVFPAGGGAPVTFHSAGQGVWRQTGPTTAAATFVDVVADAQGNYLGSETISERWTLGADGDSFGGRFSVRAVDPSGKVVSQVGGTVQGTRITLQPMGTPAAGTPAA